MQKYKIVVINYETRLPKKGIIRALRNMLDISETEADNLLSVFSNEYKCLDNKDEAIKIIIVLGVCGLRARLETSTEGDACNTTSNAPPAEIDRDIIVMEYKRIVNNYF